jgi:hypothetical protein
MGFGRAGCVFTSDIDSEIASVNGSLNIEYFLWKQDVTFFISQGTIHGQIVLSLNSR